jgi:hypothetical protein
MLIDEDIVDLTWREAAAWDSDGPDVLGGHGVTRSQPTTRPQLDGARAPEQHGSR